MKIESWAGDNLTNRKKQLLALVVESYIETAEPVGSRFLVETAGLEMSGATVRNELRELEEMGYLSHPHTSAGRVPTEAGYKYYIQNVMKPVEPKKRVREELQQIRQAEAEQNAKLKQIAKYLSGYMGGAVIVSFPDNSLYYTGLSNLFSQPEFHDFDQTISISAVFDECENYMLELLDRMGLEDSAVMLGSGNPFGENYSTVTIKMDDNVIALVGPMRMPYRKTMGILEFIKDLQ